MKLSTIAKAKCKKRRIRDNCKHKKMVTIRPTQWGMILYLNSEKLDSPDRVQSIRAYLSLLPRKVSRSESVNFGIAQWQPENGFPRQSVTYFVINNLFVAQRKAFADFLISALMIEKKDVEFDYSESE